MTPKDSPAGPVRSNRLAVGIAVLAVAVAAGFLAGWWLMSREPQNGSPTDASQDPKTPTTPPPAMKPAFKDITAEAGLAYRHEAGSTGKFYYPEVMGAGCAFFDYDGDGNLDIYFVNGNLLPPDSPSPAVRNRLYRNRGDGTFEDKTDAAGVGDATYGQGCCAADYDADGDQDLYVTNFGVNVLYRNRGDGTFETVDGPVRDPGWGQSCAFFDANGDGTLDLYVQNYLHYSLETHQEWFVTIDGRKELDYCSPSGYRGQQDRLLRNRGDGTFVDVTQASGLVVPEGTGMGLACADFDNDGDVDVFVANDSRPNFFYVNDGKGVFTESGLEYGVAYNEVGSTEAFMGVDAGDFDGDGRLDLVVPSLRGQGFSVFRNAGELFRDVSVDAGVAVATSSITGFAPVFLDYDADGDLDLYFTAGDVRMGRGKTAPGASFLDRYAMADVLLENRDGKYVDVSASAGPHFQRREVSRACSAGDIDNDGDLDLLVTTMDGDARLLRNDTVGGAWIGFRLEGKTPNLDAIGARLELTAGGKTQMSQVWAGGSYLGQRDRRQLFGLGKASTTDRLVVRWPNGEETTHTGLEPGRYHTLRQGAPSPPSK